MYSQILTNALYFYILENDSILYDKQIVTTNTMVDRGNKKLMENALKILMKFKANIQKIQNGLQQWKYFL